MKKLLVFLYCVTVSISFNAQNEENDWRQEILNYQNELNAKFINPETTILRSNDFRAFEGLEFYPVDLNFRVEAKLIKTPDELPFQMLTNTDRLPLYVKYGELHFKIEGGDFKLDVFQPAETIPEYEDYLFLPFTDLSNGDGSYGGGRYIDLRTTDATTMILDFNKSYNPYCAYNPRYSCPIPPEQNDLKIFIAAGVKDFEMK